MSFELGGEIEMDIHDLIVYELIENATIENMSFFTAWEQVELEYLY